MRKFVLWGVFAVAVVAALAGLFLITNGSLEMFPTQEQVEKTRIAGWVLLLAGVLVDGILAVRLKKSREV